VTLRLLSYNIRFGGTGRDAALASVIRHVSPDVVVLQEATDARVVAGLAEATGLPHHGARPAHSLGFLSRLPVAHHAWHQPPGARHAFLDLALDGVDVRVVGLHLSAWFSKWSERRRTREIRLLLDGIREHEHGPHVIVGDFNALAPGERLEVARMPRWIRVMIWISGRDIARDTIETMHGAGYADGFRLHHPEVAGSTFPTWDPHLRLDYAFVPARDAGRVTRCTVVTEPDAAQSASDHFPLLVELAERGDSA
jgi:exodeoxyribonuclease-3